MTKKPFVTKEKLEEIAAAVPTPFHIYDEKGILMKGRISEIMKPVEEYDNVKR